MGGRDDENVPNAGQHQGRQRVVNHGLVINRHELFADALGDRMKSRSGSTGQDDSSHALILGEEPTPGGSS